MDLSKIVSQSRTEQSSSNPGKLLHLNVPKISALLPDVMLDEDSHHTDAARDNNVLDLPALSDTINEADGLALLVTSTELLRLQVTVNELNDFLNRQSQIVMALTEREAGVEISSKRSSLLPLKTSQTHPSKVSASPHAQNSEVGAIDSIAIRSSL
jgi:hypothetical protein